MSLCFLSFVQVDILSLKSIMSLDLANETRSLKTIMEMLDSGGSTQSINIQMFEKIGILSESTYFKHIWRKIANDVKLSEFKSVSVIPLNQVLERIFKPAVEEFRKSHEELMNLSMTLEDLKDKMGMFLKRDAHKNELQVMNTYFSEDPKPGWVENTCKHIQRYKEICSAVGNPSGQCKMKVVNDLKDNLRLRGDFCAFGNLQVCYIFSIFVIESLFICNLMYPILFPFLGMLTMDCFFCLKKMQGTLLMLLLL